MQGVPLEASVATKKASNKQCKAETNGAIGKDVEIAKKKEK